MYPILPGHHQRVVDVYNQVRRAAQMVNPSAAVSRNLLIQSRTLVNNQGVYRFNFDLRSLSQAEQFAGDRYLKQTDSFVVHSIGLFLTRRTTATPGIRRFAAFPDPTIFPTPGGATFTREHLESVYNGLLSYEVNNRLILQELATNGFRFQDGLADNGAQLVGNPGATPTLVANQGAVVQATQKGLQSGLVPFEMTVLEGLQTNRKFTLEISTEGLDYEESNGTAQNQVALILDGILVSGVAEGLEAALVAR